MLVGETRSLVEDKEDKDIEMNCPDCGAKMGYYVNKKRYICVFCEVLEDERD